MTVLNDFSTTINNQGKHEIQDVFRQLEKARILDNSYRLNKLTATKFSRLENASIAIVLISVFIFAILSLIQSFLNISAELVFMAKSTLLLGTLVF